MVRVILNHMLGRRMLGSLAAALLVAWPVWAQTQTAPDEGVRFLPPTTLLLTQAHVVVDAERQLESADVLIEDGKIVDVGANLSPPDGAEVIDLSGKYLYPAFVDPLAEFDASTPEFKAGYWNENVVPQRTLNGTAVLEAAKLEAMRKAGIGAALLAPNDGIIKGQSVAILTRDAPWEQIVLRERVFQHLQLYPSRRSRSYPNSPMGAVALIRQALTDADWYRQARQAVQADPALPMPEWNVALQELQPVIQGQQTIVVDGSNELYALRADRLAREFSLQLIIRGSGREYRRLEAIHAAKRAMIVPVNFPEAPEVATRADAADATLQELMHWRLAPDNPARLEEARVDMALTADGLSKLSDYLPNVRKAIERGLSERAALHAMTLRPAQLLGIERAVGSIEVGKLANFIVVDGPLFESSTKIDETWVAGQREQWTETPENDLRGTWTMLVEAAPVAALQVEIEGQADKLTGKLGLPQAFAEAEPEAEPKGEPEAEPEAETEAGAETDREPATATTEAPPSTIELKHLAFNGYQLSAVFEAAEVLEEKPGAALLAATLLPGAGDVEFVGTLHWADGTQASFHLARQQAAEPPAAGTAADEKTEPESPDTDQPKQKPAESATELVACQVNFPLGAYGVSDAPPQPEWLLIKGATLWTCGEQGMLQADMLVHRGIIESIGTELNVPEGTTLIDATGMHVSPGIIDCHSHMATDGGVNESGQAVTAEVRIGDFIDPNDITIYRQLAGGVTTSNILHGSANPIGGQNQVIKLRWGSLGEEMKMREAPAGIKFALGENVKQSSRPDSTRYPQTRMGVEQIMRDRFEAALLYRQQWAEWTATARGLPPRRDWELEAIAEILEKKRWIHCHSYRQDEILTMLRTLEDYDVTIGSLQHILEGYKVADAMAAHGATGSSFSDWWAYKFEVYDAIPYNGALMHQAGVIVSFNSDDDELARHLNHEAAKAVKYGGVAPEEALKFVTLNPAKQLRIDTWVGSLEVGKHADFVIWNRSPLSTLSMCTQTWIDGRKYFDREEDLKRRQVDAQLHRELVQSILSSGAKTRKSAPDNDPSYWWARHDEFCHHGHDDVLHDDHDAEHHE